MGNTLVRGGAPAIQIAGALSDGILIQNLSASAPLYLGYDPSINANSFSGYVRPGGSYTTSKAKDVWLYADADCPLVYDYSSDASPGGGSQVQVINPVQSIAQQTFSTLIYRATSVAAQASDVICNLSNVAAQQSVIIKLDADNGTNNMGIVNVILAWYDDNGSFIFEEESLFLQNGYVGSGNYITTIKGSRLTVTVVGDSSLIGTFNGNIYVGLSSRTLPEQYFQSPKDALGVIASQSNHGYAQRSDLRGGGTQLFSGGFGAAGNALVAIPSFGLHATGTLLFGNGQTGTILTWAILGAVKNGPGISAPSVGGSGWSILKGGQLSGAGLQYVNLDIDMPKAPVAYYFSVNTGCNYTLSLSYKKNS